MDKQLRSAIRALKIYDECMQELSCFVGQMAGRCGEMAHQHAVDQCAKAMRAQKVLDRLTARNLPAA